MIALTEFTDEQLLRRIRRQMNVCNQAQTDKEYDDAWEKVELGCAEAERRGLSLENMPKATEV